MNATFTKLRSGEWGIRVQGNAKRGQTVTVTTRSGDRKIHTIGSVVWSGQGITLATIGGERRSSRCRECHGPIVDSAHCRASNGYCGSCAFDEL